MFLNLTYAVLLLSLSASVSSAAVRISTVRHTAAAKSRKPASIVATSASSATSTSSDICTGLFAVVDTYAASNSATDALTLHNAIRTYMNENDGKSLAALTWNSALVSQASVDAVYAVDASCTTTHDPDFGVALAKNLGWGDFISAIKSFLEYDDGNGTECAQSTKQARQQNYGIVALRDCENSSVSIMSIPIAHLLFVQKKKIELNKRKGFNDFKTKIAAKCIVRGLGNRAGTTSFLREGGGPYVNRSTHASQNE
ncbi:hypothetical protein HDU83_006617 [Entophlyctis luteolus]|nr:hypothetical protein HDU83_006617 [Entophlyctis luteolus]